MKMELLSSIILAGTMGVVGAVNTVYTSPVFAAEGKGRRSSRSRKGYITCKETHGRNGKAYV